MKGQYCVFACLIKCLKFVVKLSLEISHKTENPRACSICDKDHQTPRHQRPSSHRNPSLKLIRVPCDALGGVIKSPSQRTGNRSESTEMISAIFNHPINCQYLSSCSHFVPSLFALSVPASVHDKLVRCGHWECRLSARVSTPHSYASCVSVHLVH